MNLEGGKSRSERFHDRVDVERNLLDIVNSSPLGEILPLNSLTDIAITDWTSRLSESLVGHNTAHVVTLLRQISIETGLKIENSRSVFEPNIAKIDVRTKILMDKLRLEIDKITVKKFY